MNAPVALRTEAPVLPQPYLLFLGDTTERGFAKTAFGLRDWAGTNASANLRAAPPSPPTCRG